MAVERVPQQAYGDEGEPPAREVQQEGIGAIDRDHLLRGVRTLEGAKVRDFLRRQGHVSVVLHEELELPTHIVDVAHARTSADRKSTRLNSSHSQISYAVFCLK